MQDRNRIPNTTQIPPSKQTVVMPLEEPTDDELYRQGWWAYGFGLNFDRNPYPSPSREFDGWAEGWYDAQGEDAG